MVAVVRYGDTLIGTEYVYGCWDSRWIWRRKKQFDFAFVFWYV